MIFFTLYVYINIKELTNYKKKCRTELNNNLIYLRKRREREREEKNSPSIVRTKVFSIHIFSPRSLINEHLYRTNVLLARRRKEGKRGKEDAPEKRKTTCAILGRENKGREGNDVCKGNPFDDWKGTFDPLGLSPLLQRLETINHNGERAIFVSSPRASLLVETGLKRVPLFDEVSVESAPSFSPGWNFVERDNNNFYEWKISCIAVYFNQIPDWVEALPFVNRFDWSNGNKQKVSTEFSRETWTINYWNKYIVEISIILNIPTFYYPYVSAVS